MFTNRLAGEKSPYLLQHAHNPVDWYPWGEEAFAKARAEEKPIFLSIGYSTCHWCHVMERESFENEQIAELLNRYFVPVKVDREERPDVDRVYMSFVQATTGGGGWPMSVWLTPELKPFYGGTYYPPDNRYGRPGFSFLLQRLAESWGTDRGRILSTSQRALEQLKEHTDAGGHAEVDAAVFETCFLQYRRAFDRDLGGFGGTPKFPRPSVLNFLFRHHYRSKNEEALDMALLTLREMAKGGMYDQLGGGFHRYSVDAQWFVPHFEKMLYDEAQLAVSYVDGFQITGDVSLAATARGVLDYVLRDMTSPEGGFYSAEDADSVVDDNPGSHEKGEGAFYIWRKAELDVVLGAEASNWFCYRYGCGPEGNVEEDPHQEFTGKNILYQAHSFAEVAAKFGVDEDAVRKALAEAEGKLMAVRSTRTRPHLDDKVLTSWNGLMISAFAKAGTALNEPKYLDAARKAAGFLLRQQWDGTTLLRRWREGESAIAGFLDDYSFFAQALLDLYSATFEERYFVEAVKIAVRMRELFEDPNGGFFSTAEGGEDLVLRLKEDYDGAEPSGNSVACAVLLRLAHLLGDSGMRSSAQKAIEAFGARLKAQPSAVPQLMVSLMGLLEPPRQIVAAGALDPAVLREIHGRFLPFHEVIAPSEQMPSSRAMVGQTAVFVCENFTCQLPVSTVEELRSLLH